MLKIAETAFYYIARNRFPRPFSKREQKQPENEGRCLGEKIEYRDIPVPGKRLQAGSGNKEKVILLRIPYSVK